MKLSASLFALLGVAEAGFVQDIFQRSGETDFFSPQGAQKQHAKVPQHMQQGKAPQFNDDTNGFHPMEPIEMEPAPPMTIEDIKENLDGNEDIVTTQAGTVKTPDPTVSATTFTTNQFSVQGILECENAEPIATTQCLTGAQYTGITNEIQNEFSAMTGNDRADFAGCILRLAGHDFMDFMPSAIAGQKGGSDGCIDFNDPDNAGLACIQTLKTAYNDVNVFSGSKTCEKVSLADFIVIAGEAIMEETKVGSADIGFKDNFQFGRTTSFECSWAEGRLPNPENECEDGNGTFKDNGVEHGLIGGGSSVKTNFVDSLGLTWPEAATLMGVHTLGRVAKANSGYEGWWSEPSEQAVFNNNYYHSLIAKGWQKVVHNRAPQGATNPDGSTKNTLKTQWEWTGRAPNGGVAQTFASQPVLMLSSDMCLFYGINSTPNPVPPQVSPLDPDGSSEMTTCCAWNHQSGSPPNAVTNIHCGMPKSQFTPFMGAGGDLDNCCHFGNNNVVQPCNNPSNPGGKAPDHIRNLASDGPVNGFPNGNAFFYSEFKQVWTKVTQLGFAGALSPLQAQCSNEPAPPTDSPTLSPTTAVTTKPTTNFPTKFPTKKGAPPTFPPTRFPTPAPTFGQGSQTCWTPWFNRDTPSGTGEWETLQALSKENPQAFIDAGCKFDIYSNTVDTPKAAECVDWVSGQSNTGDLFTNGIKCTPEEGLVCLNSDQTYGTCANYKVRFNCCESAEDAAKAEKTTLTFQDESDKECKMVMQNGNLVSTCPIVAPVGKADDQMTELNARVGRMEQRLGALENQRTVVNTKL